MTNQWMGRVSTIPQISHRYSRIVVIFTIPAAASQPYKTLGSSCDWTTVLLLPASAERFVQLDEASVFVTPRGCKR